MFVKINRINSQNLTKELVVDTCEIVFVSETKPHQVCEKKVNVDTGEEEEIFNEEPRYLIGFKNGRHPQIIDKENYEKLCKALLG